MPLPARMGHLPVDRRGYPVPFFVKRVAGAEPDFRIIDEEAAGRALRAHLCWVCGGRAGRHLAFVGGPRSEASGLYADLPSHLDCARFSAQACPFLSNPSARMRDGGLPEDVGLLPAQSGENPRVVAVVVTREFRYDPALGAFRIGPKEAVEWYAAGRAATSEDIAAASAAAGNTSWPSTLSVLGWLVLFRLPEEVLGGGQVLFAVVLQVRKEPLRSPMLPGLPNSTDLSGGPLALRPADCLVGRIRRGRSRRAAFRHTALAVLLLDHSRAFPFPRVLPSPSHVSSGPSPPPRLSTSSASPAVWSRANTAACLRSSRETGPVCDWSGGRRPR